MARLIVNRPIPHDIERDVFTRRLRIGRLRHVDCDRIAASDVISGIVDGGVPNGNLSCKDQRLQSRAGQLGKPLGQHAVKPRRALVAFDDDFQASTANVILFQKSFPLMTETVAPQPTAEQAALLARVRRMMLIAGLTTALAISAVLIAIGYRLFRADGSGSADITVMLPKAARIVSTGVARDRVVVTLDVGGSTEIRSFDVRTLKPAGRLRFVNEP